MIRAVIRVGTAGWSIPRAHLAAFPAAGGDVSLLQRYATRLRAAEINSSFYRPHRPSTYEKWAAAVPAGFGFSVKVPKEITHERRLAGVRAPLERFLAEVAGLGATLGPLLVQLPPKLELDARTADRFFTMLRRRFPGDVVLEPRHRSWFGPGVAGLLAEHRVARVAADPARVGRARRPSGWRRLVYYRLHGSPRIYYSAYEPAYLEALADTLRNHARRGAQVWCIFDNTVLGAAMGNALELRRLLET